MTTSRTPEQRARHWANWQIALRTGVAGLAFVTAQTALANPSGGNVVAGSATINGQGTDRVRIDQASDRVVINWDNFSINLGQGVDFRQPNARSIALNRVTGPEISQIMGELTANGQVYLINGNGIVFGKDARVDVAGLVATSADIGNDAFMAGGALRFGTPGRAGARIVNHGSITVRDAGIAAFVAPQVANDGIITAHMGRIAFGGAQAFTLDLHGDNLIRFQVGDAVTRLDDKGALVAVDGVVDARGGSVLITASAARDLVNQSVRIGTPQAASMQVGADGKVSLVAARVTVAAPGEVQVGKNVAMDLSSGTNAAVAAGRPKKGDNTNNIGWVGSLDGDGTAPPGQAMAANGTGGTLTIRAARTILDGTINLDGSKAGGTAHITGSDFLSFGSILSASGAEAGGNIQLDAGGFSLAGRITVNAGLGKGGSVNIHTTRRAIDTGDAFIDASGLHGGSIRYTSDQQIISSGKFRASGSHGFGGSIDVSAPRLDLFSAQFYAQGGIRGGRVRLGGEFQGGKDLSVDELLNARTLVATDAVTIDVSAIGMRGNAGEIVIWSDEKTTFLGSAIARGGLVGGIGGQIEISGKETLVYRGTVETARDGQRGGQLLLDPKNIIIADGGNSPSQYALVLQAFVSSFPGPAAPQPGLEMDDAFGTSVSLDGNRLAVGAPGDDGADSLQTDAGAVYLFTFGNASFAAPVLSAIIGSGYTGGKNLSIGGLDPGDRFGTSVSLADTRLAVGAPRDDGSDNLSTDAGAVYLFSFLDLEFNASATLGVLGKGYGGAASLGIGGELAGGDLFGTSVSLDKFGNRLVVGATGDDGFLDGVTNSGAVYAFSFTDAEFTDPVIEAMIGSGYTGGKNLSVTLGANDFFGASVAIAGDSSLEPIRIAVGATGDDGAANNRLDAGAVYFLSFSDGDYNGGVLRSTMGFGFGGAEDLDLVDLAPGDGFGAGVTLRANHLAVTAAGDDGFSNSDTDSGAAYLIDITGLPAAAPTLVARVGVGYGSLGNSNRSLAGLEIFDALTGISLDTDPGNPLLLRLVFGATGDDGRTGLGTDAGAVYLFTFRRDPDYQDGRLAGTLGLGYTDFTGLSLLENGIEVFDNFGTSVSLDGNRLAVGVRFDGGFENSVQASGAVYLFSFGDAQFSAPVLEGIIGSGYTGGKNIAVGRLEEFDLFGNSVSLDGLRLAVGAPGDDGPNNTTTEAGAVYLFTFDANPGVSFAAGQLRRVLDSTSIDGGPITADSASLGVSVSLDGDYLAVGAPGDSGSGGGQINSGAVHIFLAPGNFSSQPVRLVTIGASYGAGNDVPLALDDGDSFGTSVSLDGLRLAAGATSDAGAGNNAGGAGAVYLFTFVDSVFSGGTGVGIIGSGYNGLNDFDTSSFGNGPRVGQSVSLQGRLLAVGAVGSGGAQDNLIGSGAVYLFSFADDTLGGVDQAAVIGAGFADSGNFALPLSAGDGFGNAVSLDKNRLVVGAINDSGRNDSAMASGAVYLFTFVQSPTLINLRLIDVLGSGYQGFSNYSVPGLTAGSLNQFGTSVALDGLRLAVGAPEALDAGGLANTGAVYLFSFANDQFGAPLLEGIIGLGYSGGKNISVASLESGDRFGEAVSLSGNSLAVGSSQDDGVSNTVTDSGAVFLFSFTDAFFSSGSLQAIIGADYVGVNDLSPANINTGDRFGASVSLSGTRLAVGAPLDGGDDDSLTNVGAAYLFTFADDAFSGGVFEGIIGFGYAGGKNVSVANLAGGNLDFFGSAVALQGTRLIVGAPGDGGVNNIVGGGAAYVIDFSDAAFGGGGVSSIIGRGYTGGNNVNLITIEGNDSFGSSVAIDGSKIAVGAILDDGELDLVPLAGAVYLFTDIAGTYTLSQRIGAGYTGPSNLSLGGLEGEDRFGSGVALNGNRLVVGASEDAGAFNVAFGAGGVYLFTFSDDGFTNLALAGTFGAGYGAPQNTSVSQVAANDKFGAAISLSGNLLAIGAPGDASADDSGSNVGAVYLFTFANASFDAPTLKGVLGKGYTGGGNVDVAALEDGDLFGSSVSLGSVLAVGAPGDDGSGGSATDAGAVYVFQVDSGLNNTQLIATVGSGYSGGKNVSIAALEAGDAFGSSVSLAFEQLVVGAPGDDGASGTLADAGAAYALRFSNTIFFDGQNLVLNFFAGGTLVGTYGAGYSGTNDLSIGSLEAGDRFGSSVSLDSLNLAIGAPGDDGFLGSTSDAGAVYLLTLADTDFNTPALHATLGLDYTNGLNDFSVDTLDADNLFGSSVSLLNMRLVVGARGDTGFSGGGINVGAAFLFTFDGSALENPNLERVIGQGYPDPGNISVLGLIDGAGFGAAVSLQQGRLIIGAPGDSGNGVGVSTGAAYLFTFNGELYSDLAMAGTFGGAYRNGPTPSFAALGIGEDDTFGAALSLDLNLLAVGVPGDNGASNLAENAGAVYLISFSNTLGQELTAPVLHAVIGSGYTGGNNVSIANLDAEDRFGASVSLFGSFLAVGAPGDDGGLNGTPDSGAAYTFTFLNQEFDNLALFSTVGKGYLGPNDLDLALDAGDEFGAGVSIALSNLVVGAPGDDGFAGSITDSGAVYLLLHGPLVGQGGVIGMLGAGYSGLNSLDITSLDPGDRFGSSVSVDAVAQQLAVGAPFDEGAGNIGGGFVGAVYTFTFSDSQAGGAAQAGIIGLGYTGTNDGDPGNLESGDVFGSAVSLNGGRLAIGAPGDAGAGNVLAESGAVYIYGFASALFDNPLQQLIIGNGYVGANALAVALDSDDFGAAVSLSGRGLAVGAPFDAGPGNVHNLPGAAYFFLFDDVDLNGGRLVGTIGAGYRSAVGLDLTAPVTPSFVQVGGGDSFGAAVSLDGNRLAIGAPDDDGVTNGLGDSGAVYLFTFADANFGGATLQATIGHGYVGGKNLWPTEIGAGDQFGFAVSLDGNRLAVGSPRDDGALDLQSNAGAVYLFSFTDAAFAGGALEAIIGISYEGGKNLNTNLLDASPPAVAAGDRFGTSVSLDGNRLAVGSPNDQGFNNVTGSATGAVFLFSFADAAFNSGALQARIGAGYIGARDINIVPEAFDAFGTSVSLDGLRLAVGASADDGSGNGLIDSGAVYLFTFTDMAFNGGLQRGTVGASYNGPGDIDTVPTPFGFGSSSQFGTSVSLDGNRLAIGGPGIVSSASSPGGSGAVYLLTFSDSIFSNGVIAEIIAKGADGFGINLDFDVELEVADAFGASVSLDGNRLVVGATGDDGFGNGAASVDSGAVYLFTFDDAAFSGAQLRGNLGAGYTRGLSTPVAGVQSGDEFGGAVALDGNRLAVGASADTGANNDTGFTTGAVYLFSFGDADFANPVLESILGQDYTGGKNFDVQGLDQAARFGASVSLDGNRLAVGANNLNGGTVFLFTFADAAFTAPALASMIGAGVSGPNDLSVPVVGGDFFGTSVSLDGNRLAVGSPLDDGQGDSLTDSGAVYLFSFADDIFSSPVQEAIVGAGYTGGNNIALGALEASDHFGYSVALDGLRLAVGAEYDDGFENVDFDTGAAYLFTMSATDFSDITLAGTIGRDYAGPGDFNVSRLNSNDWFGRSLSLDGNRLAVGAVLDDGAADIGGGDFGAVYLFGFADSVFASPSLLSIIGKGYTGPGDIDVAGLDTLDLFGQGVSLNGGRLVIGAPGDGGPDNLAAASGAVYFFALGGAVLGQTFGADPGADVTISASALAAVLSGGTGVTLQANNDITVNAAILVNNPSGDGGLLEFNAGRSILINAGITTDGGIFRAYANDPSAVIANRDLGLADITFGAGGFVNAGTGGVEIRTFTGVNPINFQRGTITLGNITGGTITVSNGTSGTSGPIDDGEVIVSTGAVLTASDAADAITISGSIFTNNAGAGAFNLIGGGRFRVFSSDYDSFTAGGLVGNNLYNRTIADSITQPGNLFIFSRQPILTFTAISDTRTYGQSAPVYTFQVAGAVNGDSEFSVFSGAPNLFDSASGNAGTDTIFIDQGTLFSDVGYGFDFVNGTLTTLRALLTVTADDATRTYGDSNPLFTATFSGFVNGDDASVVTGLNFSTLADEFSDAGTYTITPFEAFADNYDFDYVAGTLTITKALLTVTADNATREYGLANPAFTGSITGFRNSDTDSVVSGLVYGSLATIASNVGTFAINGSGATATNYDFSYVPGTLTITRALLTVTADNATREYGLANPTFTGSITGFRNSDTASVISGLVYGTPATIASNVGTFAITGSGATSTNYDFAYVPGTLTITRALLTVTADNATREYGLANPTFTGSITGFRNSDTASVVSGLVYGTTATIASNVGTFAITGSGGTATNYDFAYVPGTLTITRALLTVTADNATREYGLANPTFTGSITGFRNSDTASVVSGLVYGSAATIASNVGAFAITGSGGTATNYDFAYVPGTLTITRALLTVTADNATREYGLADPAFTGSITGFRNSDTASVISGLVYGSSAVLNSNIGTYSIIGSGATSTNYDFDYLPGTLTITRALLTVTANDATREYGLANPTFTGSISGLRAGDTASVVSGLVYGSAATMASNVGTFAITGSGGTATNYDFAYVPGTLTITRALLTVTADDATREYGLANPVFTGNITGFRNSDTASVVSGLVYGSAATIASNVGTFAITGSGGTATNYDFAYVPGTLTITRALLTVTADNATREYGLADPAFTGSITGFRNSDTASVISGLVYGSSAVLNSNIGTYSIIGSGATSTNYDFSYVPGTLTITRALLTVTANDATREYGLANPTFTGSISGLRAGDTASVVSGLVYGSAATIASNVGTFAITGSGGTATNYDFAYAPGTLTITRALLTVTADNATREYGLANPVFTGSITGFRNGDTASVVSGLAYGTPATIASNVGTFAITGSGATATNYDFSYVPGTLTITRALLTVTADNATREYGLANPTFTGSITGFRNSDTASVISGLVYGTPATIASNVGTFAITGSGATSTNYDFAYVPGTLTITRALLTVTANDATQEYGLANPTFTGSISGLRAGDTASVVSGLVFGSTHLPSQGIGTYAINGAGASATNYNFAYVPGTLTITRALLTVTANDATREYGLANPAFTGSITGFRNGDNASVVSGLVYNTVADITSNAGTYGIVGAFATANNYDFAYVPGTLTITRALLTVTADDATREYGLADPAFTGSITGFRNSDTASVISGLVYGSSAVLNSNIGTYSIIGSGATSTNYDFDYLPGTLTITRALLTVTANDATREYGLANPTFTGSISGLRAGDTASVVSGLVYGSAATIASNVGTFAITGSGGTATNYDFAYVPGTLTITRALLTVTANDATREYGLANPAFTGSITGFRNGDNASVVSGLVYNTVADITSNAGTYGIVGAFATANNYDFAYVPGTLTITRALLTVTADDATREYGLADPAFTGSITGFRNSDTASVISALVYGSNAVLNSNIGTYSIIGSGATSTNYDFDYLPGTLTITRALLTVTANDATREYGLANPTFTGSISGLRAGDTASVVSGLVYGSAATIASNVGTFAITGSGGTATNYDFAYVPGTLTITRALLTVTADNATREYGLANPVFTGNISGFRNSDTASVVSGLVYGSAATVASNVGTFAITGSGGTATNYDFAYVPGTLTITRALLTVTADNATREYGLANPVFTGSISGFRNSDTASVVSGLVYGSAATVASNVGTFAITGSGGTATNYDFAYVPGTLTITRALLTVTANDATREYGLANPAFTGSISGLRAGDTASVVSGLVYGTTATIASNVGTFAITGSGGTATNYDFAYVPGTLTITRALLTVTANDATREYGLANPTFTGSISGLRAGDTASVVSGLVYGSAATVASNVGTFAITGSGGTATNYDFAYVPGTLTITRALLTVTADNATREYGLANPTFTGSITGFRNSDTAGVVSGLVYGSAATVASNVGTFAITGSGGMATNYDFAYVPGTLTITRALLTVTANDATREYGLANPTFTGSISGLRAGDTASVVSGLVYGSAATIASNVGTFAITGSGGTATNYDFAYVPGTLTITRALLTVTANDATREYGLANPAFTGSITGFRNSDTASVVQGLVYGSAATAASNVGTFAITGSGGTAANYNFAYVPGTLTITKALLTITADNKSREYGLANPVLTSSISGLRNGDTAAVVSGLVLSTSATSASNVGNYAIGVSGGSALNYDFAYAPGTLAITPALLTVAIDNKTRVYGGANPELTASITGFRNGDTASVVSGLRLRTAAIARTNVGDYLITGSSAAAANYRFDYVPGTLTITKALLQVRVNNANREYGLANPAFTATISGFRNGDMDSVISGLVFGSPANIGSNVGLYAITASGASALNYDFAYTPGRLTIDQARLLITANNLVMHQGSGDPVLTVSYSGLRNGDTPDVVTGLVLRSSGGSTASPGQYIINASRGTARNYQITYRPGVMTVLPALVPPPANPPGATPPTTPPGAAPPVTAPPVPAPPPTGGGVTDVPPPAATNPGVVTEERAHPPAPANGAPTASTTPGGAPAPGTAITGSSIPGLASVKIAQPPEALPAMQVLQTMSAPLPVLVAPELRPADPDDSRDPSKGDGQRIGCAYISLCAGQLQPLWTYQPSQ